MEFIQGIHRNQRTILPEYLDDYISKDNTVRVIDAYVDTLDFVALKFTKTNTNRRGAPSYNPKELMKLYIYGYMNKTRSSRRLEHATNVNMEVIWLIKKIKPDFKTISDFRKENKEQIKNVFKEFTMLCKDLELFGKELIAVDGTKMNADNSKKNNFNDKKIKRQLKHIDEKANEYIELLEQSDEQENSEIKITKEEMVKKIQDLEERKKKYEAMQKEMAEKGITEISTVDKDARLMDNKKNGLEVAYNIQIAVDSKHKLIVGYDVNNNPSDQGNLNNMAEKAKEVFGTKEIELLADKGYYQAEDLIACAENKTTTYVPKQTFSNRTGERDYYPDKFKYDPDENVYICPAGQKLKPPKTKKENVKSVNYKNYKACAQCEYREKCTTAKKGRTVTRSNHQDFLDIVDTRTQLNKDKYLKRQMIVEHPFGTMKRAMDAGYFLTRGLNSVSTEMGLLSLAYNMKRVINIFGVSELIEKIRELRGTFLDDNINYAA